MVRVVNRDTDDRILIKGMRGAEVDLVVAGVVDSMGNLFVQGDVRTVVAWTARGWWRC